MNSTIPLNQFPATNRLFLDYALDYAKVAGWFDYDPHDPGAVARRLDDLDSLPAIQSIDAGGPVPWAQAVVEQQKCWGSGPAAVQAAQSLAHKGTYTVLTGQQAGLLGGPLYTQLKAVAVIRLARDMARLYPGRRFVPVFWIASGDSDFEEVRHTAVQSLDGGLTELSLPPGDPADERMVMSSRIIREGWTGLLRKLGDSLPGGQQRAEVLDEVSACYDPAVVGEPGGMVTGFARWMARLFRDTELVIVNPMDPALMQAARGLIISELTEPAGSEQAIADRNIAISSAGYSLQVAQVDGETPLFWLNDDGCREKIISAANGFQLKASGRAVAREELLEQAEAAPHRFVPGVMLQPVYQSSLFPMAQWVGGAAEIAYRAQATAVFTRHGQRMAPAHFRTSATLMAGKTRELLDGLGLQVNDVYQDPAALIKQVMDAKRSGDVEVALQQYREVLSGADGELKAAAVRLDPTLEMTFETLRGNLERHVDKLEKKITAVMKRANEELVHKLDRTSNLAFPNQKAQERVLNILTFLPRHGFQLIDRLIAGVEVPSWEHQVVVLD